MSETQTSQPWDTLPSIWDGWTHQACGHYIVVDPQNIHHTCATGYMIETGRARVLKHPLRAESGNARVDVKQVHIFSAFLQTAALKTTATGE
jgi:hypothetical protein